MLTLRGYQREPVRRAVEFLRSGDPTPSLMVLPTGWGKSLLTAYAAACSNPEDRMLVVQPSKELLEQNLSRYEALRGDAEEAGVWSASFGRKKAGRITYATIGSIRNLGAQFREQGFTRMLIDEAHLYPRKERSMLGGFLRDSGIRCVLGLTATPLKLESFSEKNGDRFDKWSQLTMLTNPSPDGSFFRRILHISQIAEMTGGGWWSPLTYECIPFDRSCLRLNAAGSEWSEDSQEQAYRLNRVRENIYAALDWHSERRHCLVFVPSVDEARMLADGYPSAAAVSGDTGARERREIIASFREGRTRVLFNVSVAGTGFDFPGIDMEVFGMSTASVARWYQFVGRGVRRAEGKTDCIIADMGGNAERFGRIEDLTFELDGRWRLYGTGGQLLSGMPVGCLGHVTRADVERARMMVDADATVMDWGRHRGLTLGDVPASYKAWYLTNADSGRRPQTRAAFVASLERRVRDTRGEPPAVTMPTGQHAGERLDEIPRGYLAWFYSAQEWNETNDALRRGIEKTYGGVPHYVLPLKRMR